MYKSIDSFSTKSQLKVNGKKYFYFDLKKAQDKLGIDLTKMPFSLKIVLENLLRYEDNKSVTANDIKELAKWLSHKKSIQEIAYRPARVLMQDFTGVPAVVDLAAMRDAMKKLGGDATKINPLSPVDLVIDHSVQVDQYGNMKSFDNNVELEFSRNKERYEFLKWGQEALSNFRVVPPGTGICHQVNLEYLSQVIWTSDFDNETIAYPDTLVGTDSHTTMVNGLAVLGWGVGGIEAEAAMLGQPISMMVPEVIGFKLINKLPEGATATDLVLTVTQMLREKKVVGKFVEFYGPGLSNLPLADRATIANMAPEYGATCGFFPIDEETIKYLKLSAREKDRIELVEQYAKAQGMWRDNNAPDPEFTDTLSLDLAKVVPCISGPKRPQDRIILPDVKDNFKVELPTLTKSGKILEKPINIENHNFKLTNGDIVIAAITSCTNTSNPYVMIAAGLVARNAAKLGINAKPWVKTSLAPGSKVVTEYLKDSNLQEHLDKVGFNLVGYGCTTCIGNSGPLKTEIEKALGENDIVVSSVLSGNRNFEGRIHPLVRANYLASPPLVVAYAIAGTVNIDITKDVIAKTADGRDVYLKDIWPSSKEIQDTVHSVVTPEMFRKKYSDVFAGDKHWQNIKISKGLTYNWDENSTYVKNPPYFENMSVSHVHKEDIISAKTLCVLGDSVTTDHISPAGNIAKASPAAKYLMDNKVEIADFNSYGSRRGNHEVMMRGTFANVRIRNKMVPEKEGGYTKYLPNNEIMSIYDAAMKYKQTNTQLVVIAGKEYGTGSSRDWAAKGTFLLGVKAVIAESFERIHRSNLVGMGVLPLMFTNNETASTLKLDGTESWDIKGLNNLKPRQELDSFVTRSDGSKISVRLLCRIDTLDEIQYYMNGGILHNVLINLSATKK